MSNFNKFFEIKVKMFNLRTRVSIIFVLMTIKLSCSVSITGIIDTRNPKGPMILLPGMKRTDMRSKGIFETFLHNLLDLLTTDFPEKRLPKYCRILSSSLYELKYKYARRLAKHLKYMTRMYPEDLRKELLFYKDELSKRRPFRVEFLDAMNAIFTLREHILFNDYIYDLRNYGTDDKLYIDHETDKVIDDVIMRSILDLGSRERRDLQRKLQYAVREFTKDWQKK